MKKISLKALEELAKKMPVINETDQEKYAGGNYYIDYDGGDFGQVGQGDRLALLGSRQMYDYVVANRLEYYGLDLFEATDDFFNSGSIYYGQHIQKKVFSAYAKQVINYSGPVSVVNDWYADDLFYTRSGQSGMIGTLCFNTSQSGMIFSNAGLIQRLLQVQKDIHEEPTYPGGDPGDPGDTIQARINEILAIIASLDAYEKSIENEYQRKEIHRNTQSTRRAYASEIYSLWHEQGHAGMGYEIWDAYSKCGVDN